MSSPIPADIMEALRRDDEQNGAVRAYGITDDSRAKLILSILASITIPWSPDDSPVPDLADVPALWEWCWRGSKVDMKHLDRMLVIGTSELSQRIDKIKALRMLFPDGTMSRWAKAIIEAEVMASVRKIESKQKKPK